jgi:lipid II:glycine glycyltransferase (peptidoglycan interpeptide bridge formation enzyme)
MRYDMGGVDPDGNKGVFDFKRGLGAQPLAYLGEWAWTSSAWVRILANQVLRWKGLSL